MRDTWKVIGTVTFPVQSTHNDMISGPEIVAGDCRGVGISNGIEAELMLTVQLGHVPEGLRKASIPGVA